MPSGAPSGPKGRTKLLSTFQGPLQTGSGIAQGCLRTQSSTDRSGAAPQRPSTHFLDFPDDDETGGPAMDHCEKSEFGGLTFYVACWMPVHFGIGFASSQCSLSSLNQMSCPTPRPEMVLSFRIILVLPCICIYHVRGPFCRCESGFLRLPSLLHSPSLHP